MPACRIYNNRDAGLFIFACSFVSSDCILKSAACSRKSAALRSNFCRAADELLLHGGRNSAARQILECDFL